MKGETIIYLLLNNCLSYHKMHLRKVVIVVCCCRDWFFCFCI